MMDSSDTDGVENWEPEAQRSRNHHEDETGTTWQ